MRWLARFGKKKLEPSWEYRTNGVAWKILPAGRAFFVGEDRDTDAKRVEFFCLDRTSGRELWKKKPVGEQWWVGIESAHDDVVFVHEYATPDMPDHKRIIAMDLPSGSILWSNEELKFGHAIGDSVYAIKDHFERRIWYDLDLHSGITRGEIEPDEVRRRREAADAAARESTVFPTPFDPERAGAGLPDYVGRALRRATNLVAAEYIDREPEFVLAYHNKPGRDPETADLREEIVVIAKPTGDILYGDTMVEKANVPLRDAFFMIDHVLYYVRGKNTLVAVNLP